MARDLKEIYDSAIAEKETMGSLAGLQPSIDSSQTLLNDLTSTSKVAIWRLTFWVTSFLIWWHEKLFDLHKEEIETRAAELITGTALWYRDQSFVFQHGDVITWNGNKFTYPVITASNRIIKRAAVIEVGGQVRIKVAKLDGAGLPIPLTASEKTSFEGYIQKIKFAGTNVAIISKSADLLKLSVKVYYDPLVLDLNGELISSPGTKPVEDSITSHIASLPFNGKLNLALLTDAIQLSAGVVTPFITSAEAKYDVHPYSPIQDKYTAEAGHMKIDPAFPLSTTITYIEDV